MSRITVYCLCEGYSEQNLVRRLLAPHFGRLGIDMHAPMVITRRDRKAGQVHKGGGGSFAHYRNDLERLFRTHASRRDVYFTTLIDLYALPTDFPCYEEAFALDRPSEKVIYLEDCLMLIATDLGMDNRFIPHFELHEFETLLLADVNALGTLFLEHEADILRLGEEVAQFPNVEEINHTAEGAPSKRIAKHLPVYEKYTRSDQNGAINVLEVTGLDKLRESCSHFDSWLQQLEGLVK